MSSRWSRARSRTRPRSGGRRGLLRGGSRRVGAGRCDVIRVRCARIGNTRSCLFFLRRRRTNKRHPTLLLPPPNICSLSVSARTPMLYRWYLLQHLHFIPARRFLSCPKKIRCLHSAFSAARIHMLSLIPPATAPFPVPWSASRALSSSTCLPLPRRAPVRL